MIKHSMPRLGGPLLAAVLALVCVAPVAGQNTQPVWYPPHTLYGRPVAQPFFDFPNWARYSYCRPAPLAWGYDPFPQYGPDDCACNMDVPSINCPGDFTCHRPNTWYASADFAPLAPHVNHVSLASTYIPGSAAVAAIPGNPNIPAVAEVPNQFIPVFGSDHLDPNFDAGGKFTIGRRILGCYRVEGTYMGSYLSNASDSFHSDQANLATIFSGFVGPPLAPPPPVSPAPLPNGATDLFIASQTRFNSAEVNLRYWIDMPPGPFDVSVLVGGRFMQIDDRFRFQAQDNSGAMPLGLVGDVQADTKNTLWGVQVGIATDWMIHPRFWINTDLKVGIYDNQSTLVYQDILNSPVPTATGNARPTAVAGDISIVGHWQVTPWLVFNIGYQAVIVDGVALGVDNVVNPPFGLGLGSTSINTTQFNHKSDIAFHGPVIGLMGVW